MDTTIDNARGNPTTAEEVGNAINAIILNYRATLEAINASIRVHEDELKALREQKDRLIKLIPQNQPLQ